MYNYLLHPACLYRFFARRRRHFNERYLDIIPLRNNINKFLELGTRDKHEVYNFYSNLIGNIALFIPYSIILIVVFNVRDIKKVIISALFVSLVIELLQYSFRLGFADVDDILLNTAGAVIGVLIYRLLRPILQPVHSS